MNLSLSHCLSLEEPTRRTTRRPRRPAMTKPRVKQLWETLTPAEIARMSVADRRVRLELCEHQLANKERALDQFAQYGIEAKPYMLAELAGVRANVAALKTAIG